MTDRTDLRAAATNTRSYHMNRLSTWFLLGANRLLVVFLLTAFVFITFVAAVTILPPSFTSQIESTDTIDTIFSTMITAIVTGTTLVVTIGQLVLTQENGPLGDQRNRMRNSMEVRDATAELTGEPSPPDPSRFLGSILEATASAGRSLRESTTATDDAVVRERMTELTDCVIEDADAVRERLNAGQFGSFDLLSAALDYDYGVKIYRVERVEDEFEERLTQDQKRSLADLKDALLLFGPAREHVKTLYFQWALIDLSRQILYAAVPAIAIAGIMITTVDVTTFDGATIGVDHSLLAVGAAFATTLIPFLLFVSYILRILTVAKQTLAIEPLVLRDRKD